MSGPCESGLQKCKGLDPLAWDFLVFCLIPAGFTGIILFQPDETLPSLHCYIINHLFLKIRGVCGIYFVCYDFLQHLILFNHLVGGLITVCGTSEQR